MAEDTEDRTEAATPRRLQRAREEGQVANSREVGPTVSLAVATLMLMVAAPPAAHRVASHLADSLALSGSQEPVVAAYDAARLLALTALPFVGVAAVAAVLASLGQTGMTLRTSALQPSFARLNPARVIQNIARGSSLATTGRALVKLVLVGVALWMVLRALAPDMLPAVEWPPGLLLGHVQHAAVRLLVGVLVAQGLMAALDVVRTRSTHARQLRMTKQELREEVKESDGDPHIRARIRRLRQQRARRRMKEAVQRATVVVTNPTHYAIALQYDRGSGGAPRVVAKGVDSLAQRIRDVATDARVPIIRNPPLARALWQVDLDAEVPVELFQAVAEIIAVVWRMRAPRPGPRGP